MPLDIDCRTAEKLVLLVNEYTETPGRSSLIARPMLEQPHGVLFSLLNCVASLEYFSSGSLNLLYCREHLVSAVV